jgi:hypothetical protein
MSCSPVPNVLSPIYCPECHVLIFSVPTVLNSLSYSSYHVQFVLAQLTCHGCPFQLNCLHLSHLLWPIACPILAVPSQLPCLSGPVSAVILAFFSRCPVLALFKSVLSYLFCPECPVLSVLGCLVLAVLQTLLIRINHECTFIIKTCIVQDFEGKSKIHILNSPCRSEDTDPFMD